LSFNWTDVAGVFSCHVNLEVKSKKAIHISLHFENWMSNSPPGFADFVESTQSRQNAAGLNCALSPIHLPPRPQHVHQAALLQATDGQSSATNDAPLQFKPNGRHADEEVLGRQQSDNTEKKAHRSALQLRHRQQGSHDPGLSIDAVLESDEEHLMNSDWIMPVIDFIGYFQEVSK
jgi:hypothetical protein